MTTYPDLQQHAMDLVDEAAKRFDDPTTAAGCLLTAAGAILAQAVPELPCFVTLRELVGVLEEVHTAGLKAEAAGSTQH